MPDSLDGKADGKKNEAKKEKERAKTGRLSSAEQLALDLAREWTSPGDPYLQHLYVE